MNPLWRITMDMSKSRSESQKLSKKRRDMIRDKTRKEKERRRLEALDRDRQRFIVGQEQNQDDLDKDEEPEEIQESAAEKFQKELCWCIQQTQVGLANLKPSSKEAKSQAEEAQRVLRILTSAKAPMAKKRQVMRATFGDYRTKMQQEERRHKAEMSKRMCLEPVSPSKQGSSAFYRKSTSASITPSAQILSTSNDLPGEAGSSGHDPRSLGHDPGSSYFDIGSSRGKEEDTSMQDLIQGTEGMHVLNPRQNGTKDKSRFINNATLSKESDLAADNSEKDLKQSNQMTVSPLKAERPSGLALNLNEDQPFLFNFDISEGDLDRSDTRWRGSNKNIPEASLSENSTPEKGPSSSRKKSGSRKRNRSKKKQQAAIQDKDVKDAVVAKNQAVTADKEAVVVDNQSTVIESRDATVNENHKLKFEADGEFKFNFPDPAQQSVNLA